MSSTLLLGKTWMISSLHNSRHMITKKQWGNCSAELCRKQIRVYNRVNKLSREMLDCSYWPIG